jgi:hypothetical protein
MTTSTSNECSNNKELNEIITNRRDALHNVDYTPLTSRHDIGGTCSTLLTSSALLRSRAEEFTTSDAVMEGRLVTPTLDISGMHGRHCDGDKKLNGEFVFAVLICIADEMLEQGALIIFRVLTFVGIE